MVIYSSRRVMRKHREEKSWISASRSLLASTCFSTALIVSGASSMAQTASDQEQEAAADTIVLDQIVLTASSIATTLKEAPASISVVDQDQLQQRGAPDITEALRTVPGVNVGFDSSGTRGISIRGLGSAYTLLMVDGKRINAGLTTLRDYNGDLSWIPVDAIERIEVVRGPMSTLYGSDALGGVVNIITKKSSDKWSGSLTTEWIQPESDATGVSKKVSAYVSGPIVPDELTMTMYGNIGSKDPGNSAKLGDITVPTGIDDYDINAKLSWTPVKGQLFELEGGTGREKYHPYLADGEIDTRNTEITRTTGSLRHVGEWEFGTSTITGMIEHAENFHTSADANGLPDDGTSITVDTYTLDGKVSMPLDFWFEQNLTVGSEFRYEDMNDPENLGIANSVTGTTGSTQTSMWSAAVFMEDQIRLRDDLKLTAGLRIDQHEEFGTHASPRLYLNYDLNDNLSF